MLLCLDVGNTQTVVGVLDEEADAASPRGAGEIPGLVHHFRVATVRDRTADELELQVRELAGLAGLALPGRPNAAGEPIARSGVVIASSVPPLTAPLREMARRFVDDPVLVEPGIRTGMPILYENPREVGADRIVNAVAALDLYGGPAIVVDLGTATTFDVISAQGEYLGGAIVPGVEVSLDALVQRASALRRVELAEPRQVIGRTTVESMQSGLVYGYAALVDGLCARIAGELGGATVLATGGLAPLISPLASAVDHVEPWLTLHGLRLLYERNRRTERA